MASRSRTTFEKRRKEQARMEKQREKMAKRMQRKLEKHNAPAGGEFEEAPESDSAGEPETAPLPNGAA